MPPRAVEAGRPRESRRSGGLEELDEIARRIFEQDLACRHDRPRSRCGSAHRPRSASRRWPRDPRPRVGCGSSHPAVASVPSGIAWPAPPATRLVEQQPEIAARQGGKGGCGCHIDLEAEQRGVEVDRRRSVGDDIADTDSTHGITHFRRGVQYHSTRHAHH